MRLKKSEYYGLALNGILTSVYVWYLFRTLLMAPAHAFLSGGGDGTKNYYTYLYHVLFGKGWHFEGMNYPWGEHISFTDNQPLLAYPLSYLQSVFHFSLNDLLMMMNLIIPLMFLLSSFLLCKLFIRLGVQPYLGAVFALLITFMAPNFYRVFGHFGLCYTFNLVLTIYWLFCYESTRNKWYLLGLLALNFFIAFVHMYNLLLGMLIMFFFVIGHWIIAKETLKQKVIFSAYVVGALLLSFVCVKLVFFATDSITDRPQSPWGILFYITTLKQMCTTEFSQLGKAFSLMFDGYASSNLDEGYSYIGLVPLIYVLFIMVNFLFYFFRKSSLNLYQPISIPEQYLLIIAFLSFLLSIGFPFTNGMAYLLDYLPAIKQFRSLGRISFITYYCVGIACVLRISFLVETLKNRKQNLYILYLLLTIVLFWTIEIFSYSKYSQRRVDESTTNYQNFFHLENKMDNMPIVIDSNYQCILGIPLYCIGSEKVGKNVDSEFSGDLFYLSLQKGLPIVNTLMSRTSWKQSFQMMRLAGGPFTDKSFFSAFLNSKKILMVGLKEAYLTADEQSMLALGDSISVQGRLVFYNLDWQKLLKHEAQQIDSLNHIPIEGFHTDTTNVFSNSYEDKVSKEKLFGQGALDVSKLDSVILLEQSIEVDSNTRFEFSLWALINTNDYRMPYCSITMYDSVCNIIANKDAHAQNATDNQGYWFRISSELDLDSNVRKIRCVLHNIEDRPASMIDEFLLKPLSTFTVKQDRDRNYRMYQNHLIKLKP